MINYSTCMRGNPTDKDAAKKAYDKLTDEQKTFLEDEQHLLDCYNKAYPEG